MCSLTVLFKISHMYSIITSLLNNPIYVICYINQDKMKINQDKMNDDDTQIWIMHWEEFSQCFILV